MLPCVTRPPAVPNGPRDLNFGMRMYLDPDSTLFGKLRSKVKGKGQISMKICLFWAVFGHKGYMWDYSEPRKVRWGTIGSMPTNFGSLPKVTERQEASSIWVSQYWQVASEAGRVPKLVKVPDPKHRATARCEVCVSIYITYILVHKSTPLAVTVPHGQLASHPFQITRQVTVRYIMTEFMVVVPFSNWSN